MLAKLIGWFWNERRWKFAQRHWIMATLVACVFVQAPFALLILASGKGSDTTRLVVIGVMTIVGFVAGLVRMHQERKNWPAS